MKEFEFKKKTGTFQGVSFTHRHDEALWPVSDSNFLTGSGLTMDEAKGRGPYSHRFQA